MNEAWKSIFDKYNIHKHNFDDGPYYIKAEQIKEATKKFSSTSEKEVRILCKQDTREKRPEVFQEKNLFLLPVKNGEFAILKGDGYINIPEIESETIDYTSKLDFEPETSKVGDSEMQHLDYAYAASIIRDFMEDTTLILTIRGRKYTPQFEFLAGEKQHTITAQSVQTEVDAGYEGKNQVVLIEAKNSSTSNVIIRQLYYPYRQWKKHTNKEVKTLFFEKKGDLFHLWLFGFDNEKNYHSIRLKKSAKYQIKRI